MAQNLLALMIVLLCQYYSGSSSPARQRLSWKPGKGEGGMSLGLYAVLPNEESKRSAEICSFCDLVEFLWGHFTGEIDFRTVPKIGCWSGCEGQLLHQKLAWELLFPSQWDVACSCLTEHMKFVLTNRGIVSQKMVLRPHLFLKKCRSSN